MRVPLSWLRDFAPIDAPVTVLVDAFNELGLVVDGVERVGEGLDGIVVARVLAIEAIPKADKIRKVLVDAGRSEPVQVVCGAWNFEVGDLVPLATVGAVLPGDFSITQRKMKGVLSDGMLCSGRELRLTEDHEGILILPPELAPGAPFAAAMGIEADVVFDLDITPNRPDAMSVTGVARDLAARLHIPFAIPPVAIDETGVPSRTVATGVVQSPELCPRLGIRVLSGLRVQPSPAWLARRLTMAGMRPINSVVDASNYVMLELGQPTHPYDLHKVGGGGLIVRAARAGERVTTLDGAERTVGQEDCLICDAHNEPVGIAGVMGGESSEIGAETTDVLLEVAYFRPMAIARTSKRLGLRTEASARFERGSDPEGIDLAAARFCQLVAETSGPGVVIHQGLLDVRAGGEQPAPIRLRTARVNELLGTDLDGEALAGYLRPLGFEVRPEGAESSLVTVPPFRPDCEREVDLIEEVARHYGYERIAKTVPATTQVGRLTPVQRQRRQVRDVLAGLGASEAWTPSWLAPGDHERAGVPGPVIEIENPLSRDESVLRRSMRAGLLRAVAFNAARRNPDVRLFEIGRVFFEVPAGGRLPDERELLTLVMASGDDDARAAVGAWRVLADALGVHGVALEQAELPGLHPARAAHLVRTDGGAVVGSVGELDPEVAAAHGVDRRVGWLECDLDLLLADRRRDEPAVDPSRFPSSDIDLAFAVDESTPAAAVEQALRAAAGPLLEWVRLFDVYRGAGMGEAQRSLAFRLRFVAPDRTLTDAEVARLRARCVAAVEASLPARLR